MTMNDPLAAWEAVRKQLSGRLLSSLAEAS
jgi:hypothetical protein